MTIVNISWVQLLRRAQIQPSEKKNLLLLFKVKKYSWVSNKSCPPPFPLQKMYPRTMIYFANFNIKINAYFSSFFLTVRIIQIANCYSNVKNIDHSIPNLNTLLELIMRSGKGLGLITNLMCSVFSSHF